MLADFVLEADVQRTARDYGRRDMCLFFGYHADDHFYYAHLAKKTDDANVKVRGVAIRPLPRPRL